MTAALFRTHIHLNARHAAMPRIITAALRAAGSPLTVDDATMDAPGRRFIVVTAPSRAGVVISLADLGDVPLHQVAAYISARVGAALTSADLAA